MIEQLFDIESLKLISQYSIEYGILTENGLKTVEVSILNTDETISKTKMTVKDAMYFTENGTLTLPGLHIFNKVSIFIDQLINNTLDDLLTKILENNISGNYIDIAFKELEFKITEYLQNEYQNTISGMNKLNAILSENKDKVFLFSPIELKKYLTCKVNKAI